MNMAQALAGELEQEAVATRTLLECMPEDKLAWQPHQKSMSLGKLGLHIATVPGSIAAIAVGNSMDVSEIRPAEEPSSKAEVLAAFDESIATAKSELMKIDDGAMMDTWRMMAEDEEIMAMPKIGLLRAIMLNHLYHHRGQLTVYLRLLDVHLPSVYGPTADENPFM